MAEKTDIFDSIRIKSRRSTKPEKGVDMCEWENCEKPGTHRAPKKKKANKEFHLFCLEHVRKYNQSFNYFAEDSGETKDSSTIFAERPTWEFGAGPSAKAKKRAKFADPQNLYARLAARSRANDPEKRPIRRLVEADRKALEVLGLKGKHGAKEIKIAYKSLVKIHHPDANGGDRSSEERLRAIINAYNHLKKKGLV